MTTCWSAVTSITFLPVYRSQAKILPQSEPDMTKSSPQNVASLMRVLHRTERERERVLGAQLKDTLGLVGWLRGRYLPRVPMADKLLLDVVKVGRGGGSVVLRAVVLVPSSTWARAVTVLFWLFAVGLGLLSLLRRLRNLLIVIVIIVAVYGARGCYAYALLPGRRRLRTTCPGRSF